MVLSRYHFRIILLYILLVPIAYYFGGEGLRYDLDLEDAVLAYAVLISAAFSVGLLLWLKGISKSELKFASIISIIFYSGVIGFAEEVIFRGIIQRLLQDALPNLSLAIVISSMTFGLAHSLNGAKGIHPLDWNWELVGLTFLTGIPLGLLFAITGSLFFPILLHTFLLVCSKLFF